ncbi:putative integral membrane protein [Babesia bovis T2Bo]|uniref:Membrane protein, putative n=1 Tax=Babesia bovis TaxID=5865 RepID=A7APR6_BABBO|nr:putative integral membrane protein [Babesia bovis T2Bo]EDO08550.1 putative integral membrane protein [Babesia bovis T2Bo]|eukprot:XP_001612118.1 membrane protein [Babesia bovis T2Bo]
MSTMANPTGTTNPLLEKALVLVIILTLTILLVNGISIFINETTVTYATQALGILLSILVLCLCYKLDYLVKPFTKWHWATLLLVSIFCALYNSLVFKVTEISVAYENGASYYVYSIAGTCLLVMAGTLLCGWKCGLFKQPCCRSQWACYVSIAIVVLAILATCGMAVPLHAFVTRSFVYSGDGNTDVNNLKNSARPVVLLAEIYSTSLLYVIILKLPYSFYEVVILMLLSISFGALITLMIYQGTYSFQQNQHHVFYPLVVICYGTTLVLIMIVKSHEPFNWLWSKDVFCCMVFGALAVLSLILLLVICIGSSDNGFSQEAKNVGYICVISLYLMGCIAATIFYSYRLGIFTCKKNNLRKEESVKVEHESANEFKDEDTK